jgi:hypothetical protein
MGNGSAAPAAPAKDYPGSAARRIVVQRSQFRLSGAIGELDSNRNLPFDAIKPPTFYFNTLMYLIC